MDERGLTQVRAQLEDFAAQVFAGLPRSDQRATGLRYLRGLMLDGQRKSTQSMAERLETSYQQVQQFVTSSTWDVTGVWRRLATMAVDVIAHSGWWTTPDSVRMARLPHVSRQCTGTWFQAMPGGDRRPGLGTRSPVLQPVLACFRVPLRAGGQPARR